MVFDIPGNQVSAGVPSARRLPLAGPLTLGGSLALQALMRQNWTMIERIEGDTASSALFGLATRQAVQTSWWRGGTSGATTSWQAFDYLQTPAVGAARLAICPGDTSHRAPGWKQPDFSELYRRAAANLDYSTTTRCA